MKNLLMKAVYLIILTSALLRPFMVVLTVTSSLAAGIFSTAAWADGDGGDGGDGGGDGNGGRRRECWFWQQRKWRRRR